MTQGSCQAVDHGLLIFVDMTVAVGDAVGVQICVVVGMIVVMVRHLPPSFLCFPYHTPFFCNLQAPEGVFIRLNFLAFRLVLW